MSTEQDKAEAAPSMSKDMARIYDVIGLHHSQHVGILIHNLENIKRFSDYLGAIERTFFMIPGEPSDDPEDEGFDPDDVCLLSKFSCGSKDEYVEQFRAALHAKFGAVAAPKLEEAGPEIAGLESATSHLGALVDEAHAILRDLHKYALDLEKETLGGISERGEVPIMDRAEDWLAARPELASTKQAALSELTADAEALGMYGSSTQQAEPAQAAATVLETYVGDATYAKLDRTLPSGTRLYTEPAQAAVPEAGSVEWWLKAALECKQFAWDADQAECAERVLADRMASLADPVQAAVPSDEPDLIELIHALDVAAYRAGSAKQYHEHEDESPGITQRHLERAERVRQECLTAAKKAVTAQPKEQAEPVREVEAVQWGGRLHESLQRALNALRLEVPGSVADGVEHEVRESIRAMWTTNETLRRMYRAAQDRCDKLDAARPDPFATHPATAQAPLSDDERGELERLRKLVNTPTLHSFRDGVVLEAAHQRERWGSDHDAGKTPADWFWLVGYLAGKALHAQTSGNTEKALHHTISTAAALANWHAAITGKHTVMRPGIDPAAAWGVKLEEQAR